MFEINLIFSTQNISLIMTRFEIESQNCGKTSKMYHFLEIVQYTCNTTFLYQNLMANLKKQ